MIFCELYNDHSRVVIVTDLSAGVPVSSAPVIGWIGPHLVYFHWL